MHLENSVSSEDTRSLAINSNVDGLLSRPRNSDLVGQSNTQNSVLMGHTIANTLMVDSSECSGEGNVKCRDGQSSESGYYPGCAYNWTLVAIGSALGVVAAILLVIGLIYVRNKNSTKEEIYVKSDNEKDTTSRDHEIT